MASPLNILYSSFCSIFPVSIIKGEQEEKYPKGKMKYFLFFSVSDIA
ncbi:hypothetical protein PRABACTJOHN_04062 [Parabacteroides johnsonii DSM 18315]|uniref:Uncharacterized protein n=1 Tax=Parabacteroides johnsonii DSM 18315 TaxID=537006 RepID=B7BG69_9BACT|nr:hypothetical protein PRABACTJOHN_04062 [Parabacteroides johnsonii DSM 18315]